ncbi:MAG TPA: peptidoglycan-binding domain-containing protein [Mycobacteriales bacterium]|nr:peptidoglycan-binding domain-containing protein [Mycobacteriales bacterium]
MLRRILMAAGFVLVAVSPTAVQAAPAIAAPTAEATVHVAPAAGPCPYSGAHPTLRQGSSGAAVGHLQCLLRNVWGYSNVAVDGAFGPVTRSAVVTHQQDCHIGADGIVGPVTWSRLHPDTTTAECLDSNHS